MKKFGPGARAGLAALCVAWLSMRSAQGLKAPPPGSADGAGQITREYQAIAQDLPGHGTVAFITDEREPLMVLYLAQYALAPRLVDPKAESPEYVVGWFSSEPSGLQTQGLELVRVQSHARVYRRISR